MTLTQQIKKHLESHQIPYECMQHKATPTSRDSASARSQELSLGAKALLLKIDKNFSLFVLRAHKKLDSKALKKELSAKKVRFASPKELFDLTQLVPGSVPPFTRPFFDIDLILDSSLLDQEKMAFNAGALTESILLNTQDYFKLHSTQLVNASL